MTNPNPEIRIIYPSHLDTLSIVDTEIEYGCNGGVYSAERRSEVRVKGRRSEMFTVGQHFLAGDRESMDRSETWSPKGL